MFDIGGWELLFLMIIALVVVGPKELPQLMRIIGQWTGRARAMVREFQASFDEMARQAELEEIQKGSRQHRGRQRTARSEKTDQ